ncbi:MSHA biogenesis protein MshA [Vibrio azureus]|uniref:MSHA pilin protein MshA n=1 Tax=Vibrio azureus NBRC 104587 TaxID=1219077 RepID=U3C207_9VIBR|nr:prepilin-type N-terminal cleavage/methylation domain-containing protein [Vibrio azureus]AUI87077.1 MSHA biogenesis protein MshA [Vibrio azureus]GAD75514.1 hypothetical protein VAZ01S_026_00200 [Vibrio azureus NBRC 104587]
MKKQAGFTLIELVVVIVILGILAVTAAPRFLNLQEDARKASLQGLKGAIEGASGIVFGKAAIDGIETTAPGDGVEVENVETGYGYPIAGKGGLENAVSGLTTDWALAASGATGLVATFVSGTLEPGFASNQLANLTAGNCYVSYTQATSTSSAATTTIVDEGC